MATTKSDEKRIKMLIDEIRAEANELELSWFADPEGTVEKMGTMKICDGGCIAVSSVPPCDGCCIRCSSN